MGSADPARRGIGPFLEPPELIIAVSSFRFLHAADIHLDSPLRGLDRYEDAPVEQLRHATRDALRRMVDLALEESVDLVLIAGDLYDGPPKDFGTGIFLTKQLRRLGNIPVVILRGNHDAESKITKALRPPSNVHVLSARKPETIVFHDLGAAVHGQSFREKKVERNLTRDYPDPKSDLVNIGVLHTALEGAEGHEPYAPCKLSDLVNLGYDYWALGHVHQRSIRHENPWVVFPGNLQGRHVRETGAKGAYVVDVRDGVVQPPVFHALDVLRWAHLRVDATGIDDPDLLWTAVEAIVSAAVAEAAGMLLAARIEIEGETPLHGVLLSKPVWAREQIRNAALASGEEVWLEKVKLSTRHPSSDGREALFERDDELGRLMQRLRSPGDEPWATPKAYEALVNGLVREDKQSLEAEGDDAATIEAEARALLLHRILESEDGA